MIRRTFLSLTAAAPLMALPALAERSDQPAEGAAILPTPSNSGYAPANGVEVYYAVYGEGDPLILLHGGLATIDMFGPNVALLAEGHQVIAIDLQGHGHTLPFDRPMSYEAMADDVAGLIRYLGFEKADIMGYSLGGGTALRIAIQHPDVVDKLVVVSAPYAWTGWHDYNQQGMRSMTPDMAEGMKGTPLYESYAAVAPDVNNFPILIEKLAAMMMHDFDWSAEIKENQSADATHVRRLGRRAHQPHRQLLRTARRRTAGRAVGRVGHECQPPGHHSQRHPLQYLRRYTAGPSCRGLPQCLGAIASAAMQQRPGTPGFFAMRCTDQVPESGVGNGRIVLDGRLGGKAELRLVYVVTDEQKMTHLKLSFDAEDLTGKLE